MSSLLPWDDLAEEDGYVRPDYEGGALDELELFWRDHQKWLQDCGYLLRPRYRPDWVPSWKDRPDVFWRFCEDGQRRTWRTNMDATRTSDGTRVLLKWIIKSEHPYEVDIATFLASKRLASDPKNHCIPIYDVLKVPDDPDKTILVMPLTRGFDKPRFRTVGEAVDFFGQFFEGLQFMHKHHVAHRDCGRMNVMMEGTMYPNGWHPTQDWRKPDFSDYRKDEIYTRTQRPPKYYLIDFGISRQYDPAKGPPLEDPINGGDKTVPEHQGRKGIVPCNPFFTDVYYAGNVIRTEFLEKKNEFDFMAGLVKDMVQDDPSQRPTFDQVVVRFEAIRKKLTTVKLRSRISPRSESMVLGLYRAVPHIAQNIKYILQGYPAVPTR